ncbi:MAG TPA: M48 family metalloprotease [Thermodesulfobacteriota bacterium]|nr:M48 family metalloprotease [Deltaproteobacteria bacterium]HNR11896.1 M48 family metalloprotease [Thermodesulfobacteriota bacterium]HNU70419.1 M48 family metalloprotease [Thermodesulfobacteriota bacterium]HOC38124.1 M48 family metalloprotease [Thermodesulfobacteriota bacterium]
MNRLALGRVIQGLALLLLPLVLSCTVNPVTLEKEFNIISEDKEISLGRNANKEISQSFGGLYDDQELQRYVYRIGQALAKNSDRSYLQYHFYVIDSPILNAFALPGGYIYITRGLLAEIENEAQLAGVLGHEIGHVAARHSAIQLSEALGYQMLTVAAMAAPNAGEMLPVVATLSQTMMLGYSREREFQADSMGLTYMFRSGYDPLEMSNFLYQLSRKGQGPAGYGIYSSTHPDIFERVQETRSKAKLMVALNLTEKKIRQQNQVGEAEVTREDVKTHAGKVLESEYRSHLEGLLYGPRDNPRRLHIYTIQEDDSILSVAENVAGDKDLAEEIADLNNVQIDDPLEPGTKIKVAY